MIPMLVAAASLTGCAVTEVQGHVTSCADKKPIDHALITFVEATRDPKQVNVTGNYYYGGTDANGHFSVGGYGDPKTTYWTAKVSKAGFQDGGARYEPGTGPQEICLNPAK